jgi:hypothetical protein
MGDEEEECRFCGNQPSCPCNYTTPCSANCTCTNPNLSGGCMCCCKYGSLEQREANAERLQNVILGLDDD